MKINHKKLRKLTAGIIFSPVMLLLSMAIVLAYILLRPASGIGMDIVIFLAELYVLANIGLVIADIILFLEISSNNKKWFIGRSIGIALLAPLFTIAEHFNTTLLRIPVGTASHIYPVIVLAVLAELFFASLSND